MLTSGRLMFQTMPKHSLEVLKSFEQKIVDWCPGLDQRIANTTCSRKQNAEMCDCNCPHYKADKPAKKGQPRKSAPDPVFKTQLDYHGKLEEVNVNVYNQTLKCECGNVRFLKPQDVFQVKACKPCTLIRRKQARRKWRRAKKKSK